VKTKDLAFSEANNELVFECKPTQIKGKKVAKNPTFLRHRTQQGDNGQNLERKPLGNKSLTQGQN
jgi:hypothetical protein